MSKINDLKGRVFGRLTVVTLLNVRTKKKGAIWKCTCECGNIKAAASVNLIGGGTKSCGCIFKEQNGFIHGMHGTPTYTSWHSMRSRCDCTDITHESYRNYYSRGITYCKEWELFLNFHRDMGTRPKGKTLDRIDSTKGYYKGNCRWATGSVQARNKIKTKNTSSVFRGVVYLKREGRWRSSFKSNGKLHYIGSFKDETDAAIARDTYVKSLDWLISDLGESFKSYLNFPEDIKNDNTRIKT